MSGKRGSGDKIRAAMVLALIAQAAAFAPAARAQAPGEAAAVQAPAEFAAPRKKDDAPDWPCVQRKVPHLSPATVWTGPAIDGLEAEWSKDDALQDLARTLASRRTSIEDAGKLIVAFAASQDAASKQHRLTLLFAATFSEIDKVRSEILHGIERYTRNQRKLAQKIDEARVEQQTLQQARERSEADRKQAQDKDDQVNWETRIYKERENSLRYVCENPVLLEQRLYQLAQEIQKNL